MLHRLHLAIRSLIPPLLDALLPLEPNKKWG
jgi:hypothetical protein